MPPVLIVTGERLGAATAGPGLRAEGLAGALARHGLDVVVAAAAGSSPPRGCRIGTLADLGRLVRDCDCAVVPASLAPHLPALQEAPALCVDLAGPALIESLWLHRERDPVGRRHVLVHEAGLLRDVLASADLVLCAHARQRDLIMGQLLAAGSLRPELLDADPALAALIAVVPFGVPPGEPPTPLRAAGGPLRVVWPGGLWDWLDPVTLVEGVARARAAGADVVLELWGTRSPDPRVPPMRAAGVAAARATSLGVADAVRLVEWVDRGRYAARLAEADLAATLDPGGLEARFAFRTRLLHALWARVPVLATAGEWVADEAAAAGAGWTVPPTGATEVGDLLGRLAGDGASLAEAAHRAAPVAERYRYETLVAPLAAWCRDPERRRAGAWSTPLRWRAGRAARRAAATARRTGRGRGPVG